MLSNQLRYATSERTDTCRRLEARAMLDDDVPTDDYKCGFCDVCVPDLQFKRPEAKIPPKDAQIENMGSIFDEAVEKFDSEELDTIVQIAVDKNAISGLYAKASQVLERDISNPSALFLAGSLGRRIPAYKDQSLHRLKTGFKEAQNQGLEVDEVKNFYKEAAFIDADEALDWIDEESGLFDTKEGRDFVMDEVERIKGKNSEAFKNMKTLKQVHLIKEMKSDIQAMSESVNLLSNQFAEMPAITIAGASK